MLTHQHAHPASTASLIDSSDMPSPANPLNVIGGGQSSRQEICMLAGPITNKHLQSLCRCATNVSSKRGRNVDALSTEQVVVHCKIAAYLSRILGA